MQLINNSHSNIFSFEMPSHKGMRALEIKNMAKSADRTNIYVKLQSELNINLLHQTLESKRVTQERLRSAPIIFVIILIGLFFYLGFNHFVMPKSFLFQKTSETHGKVTETNMFNGVRGYLLQKVTYEYQVLDSVYVDTFIAGKNKTLSSTPHRPTRTTTTSA